MVERTEQQFEQQEEALNRFIEKFVGEDAELDQVDNAIVKLAQKFGIERLEDLLKLRDARWRLKQRSSSMGHGYGKEAKAEDEHKVREIDEFLGI